MLCPYHPDFDATHGKLVFAAVKDTSKVSPLEATPLCFRSESSDDKQVASTPEEWPGPGLEPDSLLDDDLAQPLQFAIPDFTDVGKTLPEVPKDSPAYKDSTELCVEFGDLFKNRPGLCESMEHSIPLTDSAPIVQRVRPLPHKWRAEVQEQLKEIEELGVIKLSTSAYKFPWVFAAKKNGKVRICIDYRALNNVSKVDAYPVPRPDDVQEHLAGATIFSTPDLRSGYWQLKVRPSDRHKTAFRLGRGFPLYEWNRMPFGSSSAPVSFQRLMDYVVGEFDFVRVYLDDILVFSRTPEEYVKHLRLVFKALFDAGLTLSGEKCSLGLRKVVYLGHVYGADGMSPDPTKVDSLAGYYRHFIPHYSDRARCLQELLKASAKDEVFTDDSWYDIHDQAFVDLKQALIASDASDYAMGGVLQQDDHRPLQWLEKATSQKLQRWLLALQQYKFTVVYVPASKNAAADAVSRVRLDPSMTERSHLHVPGAHAVVLTPAFSFADLLEAQKNDGILSQLASRVQDATPLSRTEFKGPDFISYERAWKTLDVCDGLLVRERFHEDVGHVGAPRLLGKVQTLAYWPCMAEDIENKKSKPPPAPLMPVPIGQVQNMLFDPEAFARYISHTRAMIQDKVNECVTQAAMSYKASYNAKSRERLARANKLSPRWEGEWYVLKALPSLENKTVEIPFNQKKFRLWYWIYYGKRRLRHLRRVRLLEIYLISMDQKFL
ncbi:hypothetical protein FOL46_000725 [Perkinsus olseni]|uniref:Reverse transcriptase domain-containing protein n=1 Tax=Perkinsus olseni TaxID=32597 RepID=A0A7J6KV57_PEROL|nr:hypothetical protein FOL46_000725 [Perkinsus olseni]